MENVTESRITPRNVSGIREIVPRSMHSTPIVRCNFLNLLGMAGALVESMIPMHADGMEAIASCKEWIGSPVLII